MREYQMNYTKQTYFYSQKIKNKIKIKKKDNMEN